MHNGIFSKIPTYNNLFKKTINSGEDETVLIVKKDEHLDINVILIATKNGDGENDVAELVNISPGVFSNIISSDYNLDQLGEKFLLQEKLVDQSSFENYTNITQEESFISDTNGCTSFRTIELAVAYESSFCASNQNDASNSDTSVMYIIAGISQKYQQESLCVKVELSHLEGHCDSGTDPYKEMVAINSSGCSSYGLLDMFQDFWERERKEVHRDSAHLFSGTGLECTNGRCVVSLTKFVFSIRNAISCIPKPSSILIISGGMCIRWKHVHKLVSSQQWSFALLHLFSSFNHLFKSTHCVHFSTYLQCICCELCHLFHGFQSSQCTRCSRAWP